jgi:tetratricopeptide (TPR) repeat protein
MILPALPASPLEQASELLEFGRSTEALDLLLKLAKTQPHSASIFTLLGKTYANLSLWKEAEVSCGRAIECDRLYLEAYYTLALVNQHNGRLHQAIECMKKVVYLDRNYILGHYGLANLCHENGDTKQAQKYLENTMRLLDDIPDETVISGSQGVTAGRLRDAINRQQQAWIID